METTTYIGDTFEIEAQLTNSREEDETGELKLILDGNGVDNEVIDSREVTVEPESSKYVYFYLDTEEYGEGDYVATIEMPYNEDHVELSVMPEPTVFAGGDDGRVHRFDGITMEQEASNSDTDGQVHGLSAVGDSVFAGSDEAFSDQVVIKMDDETLSEEDTSDDITNDIINDLWGDGEWLYVADNDGGVFKVDPETLGVEETSYDHEIRAHSLWGVGDKLYSGGWDGVYKFDASSLSKEDEFTGNSDDVEAVTADDEWVFAGDRDGGVYKIDRETMNQEGSFHISDARAIWNVGEWVFVGGRGDVMYKLDKSTMNEEGAYTDHSGSIHAIWGDGNWLYCGGYDEGVHKVDPETMEEEDQYHNIGEPVRSLWIQS